MSRTPRRVAGVENRRHAAPDGRVWWTFRVRWNDPVTGKRCSEEFDSQKDALDFKATLRLAKRQGTLAGLDAGQQTLTAFAEEWWTTYAAVNLERNTLKTYSLLWNKHLLPRVGHLQLRTITPAIVATLRSELERDGVGPHAVRSALVVLQSMLSRAVEWGHIQTNPAAAVRKPRVTRRRVVRPLPPLDVERLRAAMRPDDAALVSVLAYAGLRPEEALALEWRHVRRTILIVEQKVVDGEVMLGQKTRRPARTIDLLPALREDLDDLRARRNGRTELLFPKADGSAWREHDWRNWRRRCFRAAAGATGVEVARPYDLRHSFASLLIHEGRLSVIEIAAQLGHSAEMLLSTYAHVIAELKDMPKAAAAAEIERARQTIRDEAPGRAG